MPDEHPTPREVAEHFLRVSAANEWDRVADLYSDDAVIEIPFAPPGVPTRSAGRETHRARFHAASGMLRLSKADPVVIHETRDPEVVVVECDLHGHAVKTSQPFVFTYIMVMRIRAGLIVSSRDYGNPLAGARVLEATG